MGYGEGKPSCLEFEGCERFGGFLARSWRPGAFADSIACSLALCQSTLVKAGAIPQLEGGRSVHYDFSNRT